jgi:uncharacterized protein (UPF0248 family)
MERYRRQFESDELREYFKQILHYKNHFIYDNFHSVQRYNERVKLDYSIYDQTLKNAVDWIIYNKKENVEDRYIFISKKYKFGIQIHWHEDIKEKIKGLHDFTSTTLSENEMKYYKENDKEIFVEQLNQRDRHILEKIKLEEIPYYRLIKKIFQEQSVLETYELFIEHGKIYRTFELVDLD